MEGLKLQTQIMLYTMPVPAPLAYSCALLFQLLFHEDQIYMAGYGFICCPIWFLYEHALAAALGILVAKDLGTELMLMWPPYLKDVTKQFPCMICVKSKWVYDTIPCEALQHSTARASPWHPWNDPHPRSFLWHLHQPAPTKLLHLPDAEIIQ